MAHVDASVRKKDELTTAIHTSNNYNEQKEKEDEAKKQSEYLTSQ